MSKEKKPYKSIKFALKQAQQNYIERLQVEKKNKLENQIKLAQEKIRRFQDLNKLNVEIPEENRLDYSAITEVIRRLKNKIPLSNMFMELAEMEHYTFEECRLSIEDKKYRDNAKKLKETTGELRYLARAKNIKECCNYWNSRHFRLHGVKQLKSVNRCKDRFCLNCQHILSMVRFHRAKPMIDKFIEDGYHAAHVVLTQPNAKDYNIKGTLNNSFKAFGKFVKYLSGIEKIRGIDFLKYGYKGAIRSFESTFGDYDDYHLHIHSILLFDRQLDLSGENENKFSNSKKHGHRLFTDFEILIQKIWYLLMNNIKVTKNAIEQLTEGYSCICDPLDESNVHEVFKYATKLDLSADKITADRLLPLDKALSGRRIIQGYGCLRGSIKDKESINEEDIQANERYHEAIATMLLIEEPVEITECLKEVVENTFTSGEKTIYITKNSFKSKNNHD